MSVKHPVLLIGSIPLQDSETVFRELAKHLGTTALRYPDGETGARTNWIRWQRHIFAENNSFEIHDPANNFQKIKDTLDRRFYRIKQGVDPKAITYPPLGFADEAIRSYAIFAKLKKDGVIPQGTKFQVAIPTVLALLSGFIVIEDRAAAEPALEAAMARELAAIGEKIPSNELSIQWDVCIEIVAYDGGYKVHLKDILPESVERVARQIAMVPSGAEVGIHLCYGDPGHKHLVEPPDASSMTAFANAIYASSPRPIGFMHLPILRQWDAEKYFAPLKDMKTPQGTEVFLGLVHFSDGKEATARRIALAKRYVTEFGVATECGFGRRDPKTVEPLLDLHREVALTL